MRACDPALLSTLDGQLLPATFLNDATARYPVTVLGYAAAQSLGIADLTGRPAIYLGGRWFVVVGILRPGRARAGDRQVGADRVPGRRRPDFGLRRAPEPDLRAGAAPTAPPTCPRLLARATDPETPGTGDGEPAVGRAVRPVGGGRLDHRAVARSRRGRAARRRRRHRQRHGHLGAGTARRDRAAPRAGRHPATRGRPSSSSSRCCWAPPAARSGCSPGSPSPARWPSSAAGSRWYRPQAVWARPARRDRHRRVPPACTRRPARPDCPRPTPSVPASRRYGTLRARSGTPAPSRVPCAPWRWTNPGSPSSAG